MGQLTRGTLISEALLIAGDDRLATRAAVWLNAWLDATYARFHWPFLQRNYAGQPLAVGADKVVVGNGSPVGTPIAESIKQINGPIGIYNAGYTLQTSVPVIDITAQPERYMSNPTTNKGIPSVFRVRHAATHYGQWDIIPDVQPSEAILLSINYQPNVAALTLDAERPIYPNDRTIIQALVSEAYRYMGKMEEYSHALEILSEMVKQDKLTYGTGVPGQFDVIRLDTSVFR